MKGTFRANPPKIEAIDPVIGAGTLVGSLLLLARKTNSLPLRFHVPPQVVYLQVPVALIRCCN